MGDPLDDWCGICGRADQASRCSNCDYSICPRCREEGRCLCGAPLGYDPTSEPRPTELQVLLAVRAVEAQADVASGGGRGGNVVTRLTAAGFGEVPVTGVLERLYDQRLIECGLSLRLPWLTDAGRARLAALSQED